MQVALLSVACVAAADARGAVYRIGASSQGASNDHASVSRSTVASSSISRSGRALSSVTRASDDGALYVSHAASSPLHIAGDTSSFTVQFGGPSSRTNTSFAHSDALFGIPLYGGSIAGALSFVDPPGTNASACGPLSNPGAVAGKVAVIPRGGCFFTTKVLNAQMAGAIGAVIVDSDGMCGVDAACMACAACPYWAGVSGCTCDLPYMGDEGSGASVGIPSFMISRGDGAYLYTAAGTTLLWATLAWNLVNPEGQVEWSLWTHASDDKAMAFRADMEPYLPYLPPSQVQFTPHWYIWDGHAIGCGVYVDCADQCVNGNAYCSVDPDNTFGFGVSGGDVVMENLRQMCVWSTAPTSWWAYVKAFDAVCNNINNFNPACSYTQMTAVGVPAATVQACVEQSNKTATAQNNWVNTRLQSEVDLRSQMVIVSLPSAVVEDTLLRGGVSTGTLLNAICGAMPPTTRPAVCGCLTVPSGGLASCVNPVSDSRLPSWAVATIVCLTLAVVAGMGVGYYFHRRSRQEMREMMEDYRALVGEAGETEQAELNPAGPAARMANRLSQLTKTVFTPPEASHAAASAVAVPSGSLNA